MSQTFFRSPKRFVVLGALLSISCASKRAETATPAPVQVEASLAQTPAPVSSPWVLQGILRQVGNYPHVEVVISGKTKEFGKGDYFVVGPMQKEIAGLPLGKISVKGTLMKKEMELAGNSGRRRLRLEVEVTEYAR
jgi:hypothetical protein